MVTFKWQRIDNILPMWSRLWTTEQQEFKPENMTGGTFRSDSLSAHGFFRHYVFHPCPVCVEDRFTVNILSSKEDLSWDLTVKRSGCQILLKGLSKINTLGDMLKAERPRNGSIIYRCVAKMQQEMSCRECMSQSFFWAIPCRKHDWMPFYHNKNPYQ